MYYAVKKCAHAYSTAVYERRQNPVRHSGITATASFLLPLFVFCSP